MGASKLFSSCSSSASATGALPPISSLYREVVVFEVILTRGEFPAGTLIESWNAGWACHLPVLQGLAQMLCTCCAASISSESCFSCLPARQAVSVALSVYAALLHRSLLSASQSRLGSFFGELRDAILHRKKKRKNTAKILRRKSRQKKVGPAAKPQKMRLPTSMSEKNVNAKKD